ncbi:SRPBCC family protein [Nonlabens sp.]|uniref:SRPBCC family protein n=1 Tax=Nonlabens sp. TaxID=1888209 RepID=UPI0026242D65|nr:SRPBCC family protein [Nonlabens sp.]
MIKSAYSIEILLPIDKVMELFKNQSYFKHWQKGLVSSRNLSGNPGEENSTREMKIRVAGTTIIMKEQITAVDLPHLWEATYRTNGVFNMQSNRFRESETNINDQVVPTTLWNATSIFKFTGMMRVVAKAQPKLFKQQTLQYMEDFKTFAENKDNFIKTDS